jgi:hypothetical protein
MLLLLRAGLAWLLVQQAAAGPRVDAALESATNVKPGDLIRTPVPGTGTASGLPQEQHERLIAAMKDWQDTAAEMSHEMFLHKYGSRLNVEPAVIWAKLDINGDGKINGKEIAQGATNLEAALAQPADAPAADKKAPAEAGGMDFALFSKMLAMDPHKPRGTAAATA